MEDSAGEEGTHTPPGRAALSPRPEIWFIFFKGTEFFKQEGAM